MHRFTYALCLLGALAIAFAGCGSSDSSSGATDITSSGSDAANAAKLASKDKKPKVTYVYRAESANLGHVLFDEHGVTLYRFDKDKGSQSVCYGACEKRWPPYLTEGRLKARAVIPSKLGTAERKDGTLQVTYFGHPLYYFSGDKASAEYHGQGAKSFGGTWYAMHPDGNDAGG